jgi:hypothetical protein
MTEKVRWWGQPFDARRYHVFEGTGLGRSLCGSWAMKYRETEPEVKPDSDTFTEGSDCKACSRKAGVLNEEND